jgi:UDP-N-acetylmuramoylalanine--D-glutamate ligase
MDGIPRGEAFLSALKGARVTVVGLARQTTIATRLLAAAGARVRMEPVFTTDDLTGERLVVLTAAAALDAPGVAAARAANVTVLGELDLLWCATEAQALAIFGGPAAANAVGFARQVLARQGRPLLTADDSDPEFLASAPGFGAGGLVLIDPSPAQVATAQLFRPRVAVLMRGADGAEPLIRHQTPRDCLVLDADDPAARPLARQARARVLWCSAAGALDHGVYVARERIAARLNGYVEEICPIAGLPRGVLPAALAAVACALWAGMAPEAIGDALAPGRAASPVIGAAAGPPAPLTPWRRAPQPQARVAM